jgi:IS30 family transposase
MTGPSAAQIAWGRRQSERHAQRRADLIEDVEDLTGFGATAAEIAQRLGKTPAAIARTLYRANRDDLARPFSALTYQTPTREARDRANARRRAQRAANRRAA